jgi:hypothetical protein
MTAIIVTFTIVFLATNTLVCFFTIFNLKLSDYMQLVPKHTDCITFQSITGFCCKIIVKYLIFILLNCFIIDSFMFQLHDNFR